MNNCDCLVFDLVVLRSFLRKPLNDVRVKEALVFPALVYVSLKTENKHFGSAPRPHTQFMQQGKMLSNENMSRKFHSLLILTS